jgi:AraC-like DNA-binding protein
MSTIAALLESKGAITALRRSLPKGGPNVVSCRSAEALRQMLDKRLIDAVVLAPQSALLSELTTLRTRLPRVPLVVYGPFRPDDGELLLACRDSGSSVAVEGVDDSIVGELVIRSSMTSERRRALADAPRVLRLTEKLQRSAWDLLVGEVERPVRTGVLARRLHISREHLSRQFGAGGAPNLKRVIDLTRVACAAQLLANPGYSVPTVVRLLHFTSPSHLVSTARRIANVPISGLSSLGPRGVLAAFARGNTRSRG